MLLGEVMVRPAASLVWHGSSSERLPCASARLIRPQTTPVSRSIAAGLLSTEACADVRRPTWWSDSELLRLSKLVVELLPDEGEIDVWQTRGIILMGFYNVHEKPRGQYHTRTLEQRLEAIACIRTQARRIPYMAEECLKMADLWLWYA